MIEKKYFRYRPPAIVIEHLAVALVSTIGTRHEHFVIASAVNENELN